MQTKNKTHKNILLKFKKGKSMKKKKSGFILSIISISLSIFAIAFGVYSLTTAKLNISGSLGFTVHDCKISVSAYMYGHSLTKDGKPITESNKTYLIDKNNQEATEESPFVICDNDSSLSFNINNNVYFSNLSSTGKPQPIKIVLKLTNVSNNTIYFEDTTASSSTYTVVCDDPLRVLYADSADDSCIVTYTVTLNANSNGTYSNLSTPVNLTLGMNFSKLDTNISSTGFTLSGTTITDVPAQSTSDLLVIPSKFSDKSGETYTTLGYDIIRNLQGYSKVIILDGITTISGYVFGECVKLKAVCIPNSVTGAGMYAFYGCTALTSVKLPMGNNIASGVFSGCTNLVSINIPYGAKYLGEGAFDGCTSLTQLIIPDTVTDIENNVFRDCTNLTSITIPSRVKTILYGAFENCKKLTSITIPASVTSINYGVFKGCTKLTSITFENLDNWQYSADYGSSNYVDLPVSMSLASPSANATNFKGAWVEYSFKQK